MALQCPSKLMIRAVFLRRVEENLREDRHALIANIQETRQLPCGKDSRTSAQICNDVGFPTPREVKSADEPSFFGSLLRTLTGDWSPGPKAHHKTWAEDADFEENLLFGGGLWGIVHSLTGTHESTQETEQAIRDRAIESAPVNLELAQQMSTNELYFLAQKYQVCAGSLSRALAPPCKNPRQKLLRMLQVSGVVVPMPSAAKPAAVPSHSAICVDCEQRLRQLMQSRLTKVPWSFDELVRNTQAEPAILRQVLASLTDRALIRRHIRQYYDQHTKSSIDMDSWMVMPAAEWIVQEHNYPPNRYASSTPKPSWSTLPGFPLPADKKW